MDTSPRLRPERRSKPINAIGVGKLLRKEGLHRDYGQNGPDLEKDGGPGFPALGSAMAENHNKYNQEGPKVVFVECDDDRTMSWCGRPSAINTVMWSGGRLGTH